MYALSRTLVMRLSAAMAAAVLMLMSAPASAQLTEIMFCGNTSRTGANLYGAAGPYTEVTGCAPTGSTRAMLVSRSGTIGGNGAAWLAYLNGGGKIITEFSISHTVYNEIYGTAYPQGAWYGNCQDNAMPQVKLNPAHPFWVANNIAETPINEASCGYRLDTLVAGESAVTALGGALDGAVMFAIRPQGTAGMLYLLEADWQDNEASYTDDSRAFMAALIGSQWVNAGPVEAKPIPTLSQWGTMLLAGMLGLFALMRLRRQM